VVAVGRVFHLLRVRAVGVDVVLLHPADELEEQTAGAAAGGDVCRAQSVGGQAADVGGPVQKQGGLARASSCDRGHDPAGRAADDYDVIRLRGRGGACGGRLARLAAGQCQANGED
jgi:hypothetical protein